MLWLQYWLYPLEKSLYPVFYRLSFAMATAKKKANQQNRFPDGAQGAIQKAQGISRTGKISKDTKSFSDSLVMFCVASML